MTNKVANQIQAVGREYEDAMKAFSCYFYKDGDSYVFKQASELPVSVQANDNVKDLLLRVSEQLVENYNTQAKNHPEFQNKQPETVKDWISYLKQAYTDAFQYKESLRKSFIPEDYPEPEDYYSDLLYENPTQYEEINNKISSETEVLFAEAHPFLTENPYLESTIDATVHLQHQDSISVENFVHICEQAKKLKNFINEGHNIEITGREEIYEGGTDENGHERKDNFSQHEIWFKLKPSEEDVPFPTGFPLYENDEASFEVPPVQSLSMLASVLHDSETMIRVDGTPVFENHQVKQASAEFEPLTHIIQDINDRLQGEKEAARDSVLDR